MSNGRIMQYRYATVRCTSVRNSARYAPEMLERRTLLSAGDIDVKAFSPDALGPNQIGPRDFISIATALDGKILVGVNAGSNPGRLGSMAVSRYNADGSFDNAMGFGLIPNDDRFNSVGLMPVMNTVLVQPDGKILVGGYVRNNSSPPVSDFLLARLNADGRPDSTFGTDGTLVTSFPGNEQVSSLALDSSGNIYAEGPYFNYPNVGFDLARYSPSGVFQSSITPSLGSNGGQPGPWAMLLGPDGSVLVGGASGSSAAVWRFTSSLTPDTSFGASGVATIPFPGRDSGSVSAIGFTTDGRIVAAGTAFDQSGQFGGNTYFVARMSAGGSVDPGFALNGVALLPVTATQTRYPLAGLATESDGKILIAGTQQRPGTSGPQLVLRRYLPNGAVDPAFNADQDPNLAGNGAGMRATGLALDNFDRPLVSGSVAGGTGFARYATDVIPPGLSANFSGKPVPVPNYWIEAEDFDRGGEGVGYHDTSPQNSGGVYRPNEGVDIGTDLGNSRYGNPTNNYVVLDTHPGEWLQYTFRVATPGLYHLRAQAHDFWSGGQFHGEIDGADVTGEITVFGSYDGSYFENDSISKAFFLNPGVHVMRVVMDKAGPTGTVGRFDHFDIDEGGGGTVKGAPYSIPTDTIEAEDFAFGVYIDTTPQNLGGMYRPFESVDINAGGSNGYSVGYAMKGEQLEYSIFSPTNSVYQLQARVACFKPGGTFHVAVDYKDVTGSMTIPDTGPWDTWTTLTSKSFTVTPDFHWMRVVMDKGGYWEDVVGDFDYFKFIKTDQTAPPVVYKPAFPRGISDPIYAEDYDPATDTSGWGHIGEGVTYHDTTPENLGLQGNGRWADGVDIIPGNDPHIPAYSFNLAVGYTAPTEWLDYTVNIPTAGNYAVHTSVANLGPGGTFHLEFDGVNKSGSIAVPDTGGYFNWTTVTSKFFNLTAGAHVMRVVMDTAGPLGNIGNFDTFQFSPRLADVINSDSSAPTITLIRDPDGTDIDWSTTFDHGTFPADDPFGLTVNVNAPFAGIKLDYSRGNPLPGILHLNGRVDIIGLQGTNPLAGATIDIGKSTVNFRYDLLPSLPALVQQALKAGYNGGAWNGAATAVAGVILSSSLASGSRYSLGYSDIADGLVTDAPLGSVQVRYTLAGDANLDGAVNSLDALLLSRNYPASNTTWDRGNFNYDLVTDLNDARLLQANWKLALG